MAMPGCRNRLTTTIPNDRSEKAGSARVEPSWRVPVWMMAAPALLVAVALAGGWLLWPATARIDGPSASVPPSAVTAAPVTPSSPVAAPPEAAPERRDFKIEAATEQDILNSVPIEGSRPDPTVFRFSPNPHILVLDFASLRDSQESGDAQSGSPR